MTITDDIESIALLPTAKRTYPIPVQNDELIMFVESQREKSPAWVARAFNAWAITSIVSMVAVSIADTIATYGDTYDTLEAIAMMVLAILGNFVLVGAWGKVRKTDGAYGKVNTNRGQQSIHSSSLSLITAPFQRSGTDIAKRTGYILLFGAVIVWATIFSSFFLGVLAFVLLNYYLVLLTFLVEAVRTYQAERASYWTTCP